MILNIIVRLYLQQNILEVLEMGIKIQDRCLATLYFADDQVIVAICEEDAYAFSAHRGVCSMGFRNNINKTIYICMESKSKQDLNPKI